MYAGQLRNSTPFAWQLAKRPNRLSIRKGHFRQIESDPTAFALDQRSQLGEMFGINSTAQGEKHAPFVRYRRTGVSTVT